LANSGSPLEGVVTSGPKTGTQGGNHYDYSAIEESTVSTVGNTADAPTKGLQINVILKSGGDQFHGAASFFGTNHRLEFDNVNDTLRSRGVTGGNPVNSRWDAAGELGGRIIPNKLWFYYSTRRRGEKVQTFNAFHDDGVTPSVSDQFQYFHTGKLSYQMNPANKFVGFRPVRSAGRREHQRSSSRRTTRACTVRRKRRRARSSGRESAATSTSQCSPVRGSGTSRGNAIRIRSTPSICSPTGSPAATTITASIRSKAGITRLAG
jgi:hypothetical protein